MRTSVFLNVINIIQKGFVILIIKNWNKLNITVGFFRREIKGCTLGLRYTNLYNEHIYNYTFNLCYLF